MKYSKMKEILEEKGVNEKLMAYSLYGSQNYNADLIGADYDYHVFVFYGKDKLLGAPMKTKTYQLENGSIRVHDVRNLLNGFHNMNITMLEILVSDSLYVTDELKNLMAIIRRQDLIKRSIMSNPKKFVDSSVGIMMSYKTSYEKTGDAKYLTRMTMFYAIFYSVLSLATQQDVLFKDCLTVFDRTKCLNVYKGIQDSAKFADDLLNKNMERIDIINSFSNNFQSFRDRDNGAFEKNLTDCKIILLRALARL